MFVVDVVGVEMMIATWMVAMVDAMDMELVALAIVVYIVIQTCADVDMRLSAMAVLADIQIVTNAVDDKQLVARAAAVDIQIVTGVARNALKRVLVEVDEMQEVVLRSRRLVLKKVRRVMMMVSDDFSSHLAQRFGRSGP